MRKPLFNRVVIVGLGLIGGSLALALKKRGIARRIIGVEADPSALRKARARDAIDEGFRQWTAQLEQSDLIILALSPGVVPGTALQIASTSSEPIVLTDVSSTKGHIVRVLERDLPQRIKFVGGHPMAGSHRSGIQAADPDLFSGAPCVVTRTPRTDRRALAKVSKLWSLVGGKVLVMDPARHDRLVAQISHIPHLAAVGLTLSVSPEALKLAGGGFSDTTRVALSNTRLWFEICLQNEKEVIRALDRFIKEMVDLRDSFGRPIVLYGRKWRKVFVALGFKSSIPARDMRRLSGKSIGEYIGEKLRRAQRIRQQLETGEAPRHHH